MPDDSSSSHVEIGKLINKFISSRQITIDQYQHLSKILLADGMIDEQERQQINRLFDAIQIGAVKILG